MVKDNTKIVTSPLIETQAKSNSGAIHSTSHGELVVEEPLK